jgi:zinc-binding in reverse transcriptase
VGSLHLYNVLWYTLWLNQPILLFMRFGIRVILNLISLGVLVLPWGKRSSNLFLFFILYNLHILRIQPFGCGNLLVSILLNQCTISYVLEVLNSVYLNRFWALKIPLKYKLFIWMTLNNKILTEVNLWKRKWTEETFRVFCSAIDIVEH